MNLRELDIRKWHQALEETRSVTNDLNGIGFIPEAPAIDQLWKNFTSYTELLQRVHDIGTWLEWFAWEKPKHVGEVTDNGKSYKIRVISDLIDYLDEVQPL